MRNLFCKRLAACLCMTQSASPSPACRLVTYRNPRSVDIGNSSNSNDLAAPSSATTETESAEPSTATLELSEDKMRNDWILAADVLNRVCAIVFTVILVGGTLFFFLMFAVHP